MTPSRRRVLAAGVAGIGAVVAGTATAGAAPEPGLTDLERREPARLRAVVSRSRPIEPLDYVPPDLVRFRNGPYELRAEVAHQLGALVDAAARRDLGLQVISGFRSYQTQAETYEYWVSRYGSLAKRSSARPGHSEHQTGLAVDLDATVGGCYLDTCFGLTPEGRWVSAQAHRFGFLLSYPEGMSHRTGFSYEPWHIRYVGPRIAGQMHRLGIDLLPDYLSAPHASAGLGRWLGGSP